MRMSFNRPEHFAWKQEAQLLHKMAAWFLRTAILHVTHFGLFSVGPGLKRADELHENDEDEADFQVVQKQPRRKNQQYSIPCESRSSCENRLKCKYHHTDDEKKFFRNLGKDKECRHKAKSYCKHGQRCFYAHSDKDSFCCNFHKWGHLQEKYKQKS